MARTEVRSAQIRDATIARADLDTVTPGSAVVAKIVAGAGITISQTGADSGTGDVTVTATGGGAPAAHRITHETGGTDALTALSAAILTTGNLPFARVQLSASPRLLGRGTAAAGAMEELTLGTGLSMAGTVLNVGALAPAAHATTHQPGGADPMAVDAVVATGSLRTIGTGAQQACAGNDARLTNARTPTAHASTHQPGGGDAMAVDAVAATGSLRTLGTGAQQAAAGTDARFTDARTPTAHATSHKSGGSDVIALDTLAAPTDITTLNASATAHGLLPKLSNVVTQFLTGTGTWAVPAGGTPTAHATTHNTGGSDPLTALSAAILTTGTLPFARVQLSASPRLLGRGTAAAGAMEEITLGTGLSMTATTLSITGADEVFIGTADPGAAYELWYDTDEPGIDPTILPHHATHEPGGADALVNAVWTNRANVFTKNYAIGAHAISIQAQNPTMSLIETAAPADARMWRFIAYGQLFYIMSTNDAETTNLGALVMDRLGGLTCGRTINMQGPAPFLALTDTNQAVDTRAFIIQNSGGYLTFAPYNDAFTSAGWTNIRLNRNGDTLVCPSQSGSRLQFGGATSGQPALRWSSTFLECVLADNSNWAGFRCSTIDAYSTVTVAGAIIANSTVTITGALNANGSINCFQTITLKDGANPSCGISQNANYLRFVTSNYGQVTYMDTAGNWTLSGAVTSVGGIEFASTALSASLTCLDYYKEISWIPTFRCSASGGVPAYSIQHGLACKIGRFVYFGGRCAISSKGSMPSGGWIALDGLPWVSEGTIWGGGIYAGYVVGATGTISAGVGGYVPPGGQYVQLTINSTSGIALLAPDWILGSFDIIFFGAYYANT